jgi:hypothetical protein
MRKLTDAGHPQLCDELYDYGIAFDLQRDQVRLPVARALLDAVTELTPELAAMEQWDVDSRGPYFGGSEGPNDDRICGRVHPAPRKQ